MSDREDDQDKIRKLLKSQPLLTPPDSFYEGVRRRIASNKSARKDFRWALLPKVFASACVVMLVIWAARDKQTNPQKISGASQRTTFIDTTETDEPVETQSLKKTDNTASLNEARRKDTLKDMTLNGARHQAPNSTLSELKVRRMVQSVPASAPLNERADVHLQAREMDGAASQNSFAYSDQLQAKNEMQLAAASPRDDAPTLKSKSLGGAKAHNLPTTQGALAQRGNRVAEKEAAATAGLNIDADWLKCRQDTECTLVPEPGACMCACSVAINKKYEADYRKLYAQFCLQNPSSKPCNKICPDIRPVCAAGACDVLIKN